ncbi:MAG: endonuclease/exonuclease/phosphatase family protein [Verrucomicrobiota bacterium]
MKLALFQRVLCAFALLLAFGLRAAETFTVATYNVENYLDKAIGTRTAKTEAAKAKIREGIRALNPDVLALQEMGTTNALLELRASLKAEGLDFPHWEHVRGFDTNIFVAVLSRFPIVARRPHTNENYLLNGRRLYVSRGFAEVDIKVGADYTFTLITAHLKSKRPVPVASEADMREQEALRLREIISARLAANPRANLVVLGDFNDTRDSKPIKTLLGGRGADGLVDTRPAERNGDNLPNPVPYYSPRNITWTYYYGVKDTYERIDYIFISKPMAREWNKDGTFALTLANWGAGSDHRPIAASFFRVDK